MASQFASAPPIRLGVDGTQAVNAGADTQKVTTQAVRNDVPSRSTRHIVLVSLGVALVVAVVGIASTGIWLTGARDPSCGDSDCDQGVALIAVFLSVVSLALGAAVGAGTGAVLAWRNQPPGRRRRVVLRAGAAALLPLALVLLYFAALT